MYNLATAYSKRPSELFIFETEIGAWYFDEACLMTGRRIENAMNEGKNPFALTQPSPNGRGGYARAARHGMKRVKIKENGTW